MRGSLFRFKGVDVRTTMCCLFALAALFKNVFKIRKGSFKDWTYYMLNLTKYYVTQYAGLNTF